MVFDNAVRQAALNAICALLNSGNFQLTSATNGAGTSLAVLPLSATAFAAASLASPSVAASNPITAVAPAATGTVLGFNLRTSGNANRLSGSVDTSGTPDLTVTNNVIPAGTSQVSCTGGLTLSLQM